MHELSPHASEKQIGFTVLLSFCTQACKEQLEEHFSDVQTALASHGHSLEEMASIQEHQLSEQSEAVTTWSRDQDKHVDQVNTRVTQFLLEELKDDLPTGLSVYYLFFAIVGTLYKKYRG